MEFRVKTEFMFGTKNFTLETIVSAKSKTDAIREQFKAVFSEPTVLFPRCIEIGEWFTNGTDACRVISINRLDDLTENQISGVVSKLLRVFTDRRVKVFNRDALIKIFKSETTPEYEYISSEHLADVVLEFKEGLSK
ncbi:hypothetical protein [Photobacterium leiognathi]|uniref:hypothetical protein n=1 Tax=Photobacterium leiognathi TaxID=553611 RepID=UPI002981DF28|nr:hypothetical protein [Photobacterium leiognathi]